MARAHGSLVISKRTGADQTCARVDARVRSIHERRVRPRRAELPRRCYEHATEDKAMSDIQQTIKDTVEGNRVVLFMKGSKLFPQCGFSARAVDILKKCGVEFKDVNVLSDPALRQGVKDYSSWPTVPQIYIDGKFVGGSDILAEMFESGELQKLLAKS
jgi:monothiol glutaredoxin